MKCGRANNRKPQICKQNFLVLALRRVARRFAAALPMELTEENMPILKLLHVLAFLFLGVGEFLEGVAKLIDTEIVRKYFEGKQSPVAQGQPLLSEHAERLYAEFGWQMDLQHQQTVLRREILKLPSLPEEGY